MKKIIDFSVIVIQTMIPFTVCAACFYYQLYLVASIQLLFCFGLLNSLYKTVQEIKQEIVAVESRNNFKQNMDKIIQQEYSRSLQETKH